MNKLKAKVTSYVERIPFNFQHTDPPVIILPFYSPHIPDEFRNWSLVSEKDGEVQIENGKSCVICRIRFLDPEPDKYLKPGLLGYYVPDGKVRIASVEVLDD